MHSLCSGPRDGKSPAEPAIPSPPRAGSACLQPPWVASEAWGRYAPRPQGPERGGEREAAHPRLGSLRARPRRLPGRGRGSVSAPTPLPRRAPPLSTLGSGLRPGAVTTPFWLVISSSPRPARPGRTAHLRLGVQPSGLPFLSWLCSRPVRSVLGTSLLEDCQPCAFLFTEAAQLVFHIISFLHCSSCELSLLWECRILFFFFFNFSVSLCMCQA